jgi:hypothetical protein
MHRLPSLAVEYIKIVTHGGLVCNCVVANHTKPWVLFWGTWPYRGGVMQAFTLA